MTTEERRAAAQRWVMDPVADSAADHEDLAYAVARAGALLDVVEVYYRTAKAMLDSDGVEVSSLALVMDELHAHQERMAEAAVAAHEREPERHLRAVPDGD